MQEKPVPFQEAIASSLPQAFEFYHLGRVVPGFEEHAAIASVAMETDEDALDLIGSLDESQTAYAFAFSGDFRGSLLVIAESETGSSSESSGAYEELSNVFASRIASGLPGDVLISPPKKTTVGNAKRPSAGALTRTYLHVHEDIVIPVHLILNLAKNLSHAEAGDV